MAKKHYATPQGDYIGQFEEGDQPVNAIAFSGAPPAPPITEIQRLEQKLVEKGVLTENDLPDDTRAALAARKVAERKQT